MKKLICLTLALMLLLCACAAPDSPEPTTTEPPATDPTTTEPPVTEPPATQPPETEPQPTDPPEDPEPFVAHEKFDAKACSKLIGTWTVTIILDNDLQNLSLLTGETAFTLHYTFGEDGHFAAWADPAEFDKAVDDYETMVIDHMVDLSYITFMGPLEYQGVPEDEINERWLNGQEQKAREECEKSVAALNLYHRFKCLLREGQYYVSDGKLYTQIFEDRFESNSYTISGTLLTLRNTNNMSVYRDICVNFPLKLTKSE